jgi:pimeloyl-ACP methyl ester carboxylesterase
MHRAGASAAGAALWLGGASLFSASSPPQPPLDSPTAYDAQIIEPHLVDIGGGRRLNMTCVGEGAPVIVFLQGGEGSILNWRKVERPIAAITRVCFYDRAGFGYSDPPAGPITALSETDDLRALLKAAHIKGPVILVGHSIGGFYATMYADRFLADVAGLVLVEPGFAGQTAWGTPEQRKASLDEDRRGEARLPEYAALARRGLSFAEAQTRTGFWPTPNSPAEAAYLSHMAIGPDWYEAELSQSRNYAFGPDGGASLDTRQEEAVRRDFGDLPLIVLSAEQTGRDAWQDDTDYHAWNAAWRAGHAQLAARSSRGRASVVPNTHHFIQRDRPDVVIAAVKEVVDAARGRGAGR